MHTKATGINIFQQRVINWSARKRGRVQRTHIWIPTIKSDLLTVQKSPQPKPVVQSANRKLPMLGRGVFHPPKKIMTPSIETKNIMAYSAKNKKANLIPPYSVWKPPISSDSASGISKGALLHSASVAMKKMIYTTKRCGA